VGAGEPVSVHRSLTTLLSAMPKQSENYSAFPYYRAARYLRAARSGAGVLYAFPYSAPCLLYLMR